jgi:hypothetical protein
MFNKINILTFAKGNFIESQTHLKKHLNSLGLINQKHLTDNDLPEWFIEKYKHILKYKRGFGYCIWKPFIILQELEKISENEILFYLDSTDLPKKPLFDFIVNHFGVNDILLFNRGFNHGQWTKRDTFTLMNCDSEKFYNSVQLEAGVIALRKTESNLNLIREWFENCTDSRKLTEEPNTCGLGNVNFFREHRYDQSILTNICIQKEIPSYVFDTQYIEYNFFQPNQY